MLTRDCRIVGTMSLPDRRVLLLLLVGGAGGVAWWSNQPPGAVRPPDGVLAAQAPEQALLDHAAPMVHGDYLLQPLARFEVHARLLSVAWYRSDRESDLAPLDFALGWGPMSDNALLDQLEFDHGGRFFLWHWRDQPPADPAVITRSATNVHLIPADPAILGQLRAVGAGRVVRLRGLLVEARSSEGWRWRSSLSREDSGGGACELLLVQAIEVEAR